MTPTAEELWNDIAFVTKRMQEQSDYITSIGERAMRNELSVDRGMQLLVSSLQVFNRFSDRARELNKRAWTEMK